MLQHRFLRVQYIHTFVYLSSEMQMRMFPERKRPKILKKAQTLQRTSPAVHITVAAQPISTGIIRNVTCRRKTETNHIQFVWS